MQNIEAISGIYIGIGAAFYPGSEVKIPMPCGTTVVYSADNFPKQTTPCPCGDPKHFVVKYAE